MAKTELTRLAERLIYGHTNKMGTFGCFEVTLGWFGKEIVDFITYDTNAEIRCYEIKVSKADFNSNAKKTFVGHFNYFIMPEWLYKELMDEPQSGLKMWVNSYGVGVFTFKENSRSLYCAKKAKRRNVTHAKSSEVLESMLRSTNREMKKFYKVKPYWE